MDTDYHDLACEGRLAQGFDQWDLKHPDGWSVAHEAARTGHLPPDFTRWEIRDADGWTVAHTAAEHGHLPPDFPHMDWVDVDGLSVGKVYAKRMNTLPANTEPAQKPNDSIRTMAYDFSKVRPPKNPIDPEEVATVRRILRQYPYEVEDDRIRLHPELKVTSKERLIMRKYLMAKGHHAAKDAVVALDAVKDASPHE